MTRTGGPSNGKKKNPDNKKPLSSISAGAHQPTGAVLKAIIKGKDISATAGGADATVKENLTVRFECTCQTQASAGFSIFLG
jgi:hypothetical protein